jgi:hypothetical protein
VIKVTAAAAAPHAVLVTRFRKMLVSMPARVTTALRLLRVVGLTADAPFLLLLTLTLLKQLRLAVCWTNMIGFEVPEKALSGREGNEIRHNICALPKASSDTVPTHRFPTDAHNTCSNTTIINADNQLRCRHMMQMTHLSGSSSEYF